MPYDLQLPNGVLLQDIPDDIPDSEVRDRVLQAFPDIAAKQKRTWGEAGTDVLASLGSGVGQFAQFPEQLKRLVTGERGVEGYELPTSVEEAVKQAASPMQTGAELGKRLEDYSQENKSAILKAREAARSQKIQEAEGFGAEVGAAVKSTISDPALLSSFFFEQVPNLIGSYGFGALTKGGTKLLMRSATEEALAKAGVRGAIGGNAIMQGTDVGSDTYDQIYAQLKKERPDMDDGEAHGIALSKGRAAAIEAATISLGTSMLPGGSSVERALLGKTPPIGGFLKNTLGEILSEGIEEGGGALAKNYNVQQVFPETDLMKGVGAAAGLGALGGALLGGGANLMGTRAETQGTTAPPLATPPVQPPLPQTPGGVPPTNFPDVPEFPKTPAVPEGPRVPPSTTLKTTPEGELERDLFGVVPVGRAVNPREMIGPEMPGAEELAKQQPIQFPGQQELFTGPSENAAQPPFTPEPKAPEPKPVDIPTVVRGVVDTAKQDPNAPKLLKANNPATAKIVSERIAQQMVNTPDPVQAIENLFTEHKTGKGKGLSDAQQELLEHTYFRLTGRQVEEGIKERAFMAAQQADFFGPIGEPNGEQPAAPTPGQAGPDVGGPVEPNVPTEPAEQPQGNEPGGVARGPVPPEGPAGGTATQPVALTPEQAWETHRNPDQPAFGELHPEEQAAWTQAVSRNQGTGVNFARVMEGHTARNAKPVGKSEAEVKAAFAAHGKGMSQDIEKDITGKNFNQVLQFLTKTGPEANREIAKKLMQRAKELVQHGYSFKFHVAKTSADATRAGYGYGVLGRVKPDYFRKHMDISVAGVNSGQPFGAQLRTVTHESTHAVTAMLVEYGERNPTSEAGKIVKELKKLSNDVRKHLEAKVARGERLTPAENKTLNGTNALGNHQGRSRYNQAHEMLAHGMTSEFMQEVLESIPYKGRKNLFSHFVDLVRQLIGLNARENTALSQVIRLTEGLLNTSLTPIKAQTTRGRGLEETQGRSDQMFKQELIDKLRTPAYKGREKLVELPIRDFLALAEEGNVRSKQENVDRLIKSGAQFTSLPQLMAYQDEDGNLKVEGHEGRHRARALLSAGFETMPVILRTNIRWSEQNDPGKFDYVEQWPKKIVAEKGNTSIPMPISREQSEQPYGVSTPTSLESTETPAFKRFFGNSVVVDENGKPQVVYHGTQETGDTESGAFDQFAGFPNWFATEPYTSNGYAKATGTVYPAYLSIQKPLNLSFDMNDDAEAAVGVARALGLDTQQFAGATKAYEIVHSTAFAEAAQAAGFDGIAVNEGGYKTYATFDPSQAKSATGNRGTYEGPNMMESAETPWAERETPNQFGRENALTGMHRMMRDAYDESNSPDEAYQIAYEASTPAEQYILRQLKKDDFLGFDYPHQAIEAILQEPGNYDLSPQLKTAISRLGNQSTLASSVAPGPAAVPGLGQPYTLPRGTKTQPAQTAGQKVNTTVQKVAKAYNNGDMFTKFRIAAVDQFAGLSKTLSSLPVFANGQLRADMLMRSFTQTINLIKNGLQSGIPVLNADGTVVIQRSADNLARSQKIADGLDKNPIVKGTGMTGREYVAEVARHLRGEEIIQEDKRRSTKAKMMMAVAKQKMAEAKNLSRGGGKFSEVQRLVNEAKSIRAKFRGDVNLKREKQTTQAHIDWAKQQVAAVPELQQIFDTWRNINLGLIQLWEDTGKLTKQDADRLRSFKNYVPLYAAREDLAIDKQEGYTGARTGTKSVRGIEYLEGSDLQRNIWENWDKHYASMTAAAFLNQTRKVAVEQLRALGAARVTNQTDDNVNLRYEDVNSPDADKNGLVHVIVDNPNDLAAFQAMHYELTPLMKGMSAATQALRTTALLNPMYWLKQLIRDPLHAALVTNTGITTPFHSASEFAKIISGQSEEAKLLAARGVIGQVDSTIDIHDFLKQAGTQKLTPSMLDKMLHKVMQVHEASDAATRVALFKKAKQDGLNKGMSEKEATDYGVFVSRESINFGVRGNSRTLASLRHMIPFLSASITSLDTLYRAATGYGLNPQEKAEMQRIFYSRAAMMAVLATVYAMSLQDDDDYRKLPANVKDNNWLLPNPWSTDGHSFIKIPVPFEIGFFFKTLPEVSVRYLAGNATGKEMLVSIRQGIMHNLPGEGILIPQAVKPALEAVTNYSFFTNRAIEGMSDQGLPVAQRGPNASEIAKMMSKMGLDSVGLSPAKIDHLIQGYMAELGTFTADVASDMIAAAEDKTPPTKNIEEQAFFKSFMTNPKTSSAATDFYEIAHTAQETVTDFNRAVQRGDREYAAEIMSDEEKKKLYAIAPITRNLQNQMNLIRKKINYIKSQNDRDPDERRDEINELMRKYDAVARNIYDVMEKAGIER